MSLHGCFPLTRLLSGGFVNKDALWKPPEISGWLEQKGNLNHSVDSLAKDAVYRASQTCIQGSYLFCFPQSTSRAPEGMIPLEYALLEASEESKDLEKLRYTILIKLHKAYEDYCTHCSYKLASGKQEIREAWFAALSHAVLPTRVLVRELQSCGRLEGLLSDKERLHRTHKSKISFFKPGRLVDDAASSRDSRSFSIQSTQPPDPLNTRVSFAPLDPQHELHEQATGDMPESDSRMEGLQEMVDESSELSFGMAKRDSNIQVLSLLQRPPSTDPTVYPPAVPPGSPTSDTWVSHDNPLGFASGVNDPSEALDRASHASALNRMDSGQGWERRPSLPRAQAGRGHPTIQVSDSITEPTALELEEIGMRDLNEAPRDAVLSSPARQKDFPGFAPRTRHAQATVRPTGQVQRERVPEDRVALSRSATDDPRLESAKQFEIQAKKRQTVHSYTPNLQSELDGRLSWYAPRNDQLGRPRFSKFVPYVPSQSTVPEYTAAPSMRPTRRQITTENAIAKPTGQQSASRLQLIGHGSPSFEEELRDRLNERRAEIERRTLK